MAVKRYDFTFEAEGETLAATIDYSGDIIPQPVILSLHGGGPSGRERIAWLAELLADKNHPLMRYDHSGQGDSTGDLKKSSLKKRTAEALAAAQYLRPGSRYTLIGTSMGGHVALELLNHLPVDNLILFCPAAYAAEAFAVPFDSGFTDIIRTPHSYANATIFENLKNFTGNLLIIIGSDDAIIPPDVIDLYKESAIHGRHVEIITLDNAPHVLHGWLADHPEQRHDIFREILALLA
ncbi:MAG TPA: alpha/beta fold hydrolase [Alphaproteobacteria bacterium]